MYDSTTLCLIVYMLINILWCTHTLFQNATDSPGERQLQEQDAGESIIILYLSIIWIIFEDIHISHYLLLLLFVMLSMDTGCMGRVG